MRYSEPMGEIEDPGMMLTEMPPDSVGYAELATDDGVAVVAGGPYPGGADERRQMVVVAVT